jgi:hypothetical protein
LKVQVEVAERGSDATGRPTIDTAMPLVHRADKKRARPLLDARQRARGSELVCGKHPAGDHDHHAAIL